MKRQRSLKESFNANSATFVSNQADVLLRFLLEKCCLVSMVTHGYYQFIDVSVQFCVKHVDLCEGSIWIVGDAGWDPRGPASVTLRRA